MFTIYENVTDILLSKQYFDILYNKYDLYDI